MTTEDVANASSELGLPSTPSEERVVDAANINKVRRKSTPRYTTLLCHVFFHVLVHVYNIEGDG